jgi:hypothetical protein
MVCSNICYFSKNHLFPKVFVKRLKKRPLDEGSLEKNI